jgi:hypothetical protein
LVKGQFEQRRQAEKSAQAGIAENLSPRSSCSEAATGSVGVLGERTVKVAEIVNLVQEFAGRTMFRVGKWYHQGGETGHIRESPGYRDIERPHAEVHRAGREALRPVACEGESNPGLLQQAG